MESTGLNWASGRSLRLWDTRHGLGLEIYKPDHFIYFNLDDPEPELCSELRELRKFLFEQIDYRSEKHSRRIYINHLSRLLHICLKNDNFI
jgi:hypothetical protein